MTEVSVELGDRTYPIHIGTDLIARLAEFMGPTRGRQIVLVTNPTVAELYQQTVCAALSEFDVDVFAMPDGEEHKTLATYTELLDFILAQRHNRSTCVVALGGGVVGDLAGFAAANSRGGRVDNTSVSITTLCG